MSKHTPGPWHWDSDPVKGDQLGRVRYRVTTTGKTITQCYYSNVDPCAEWDARLIAAAPDMLNALKDCLAYMLDDQSSDVTGAKALDSINAAIAKAEGTP